MWSIVRKNKEKIMFFSVAAVLFLVAKYVIPLVYPFLLGALFASVLYPAADFLYKKCRIGKGVGALLLLIAIFCLVLLALGACGYGLVEKGYEIAQDYEVYMEILLMRADQCCDWIEKKMHLEEGSVMYQIKGIVTPISKKWQETMVPDVFEGSVSGIKKVFSVGIFWVVTCLTTVFLVKEWDEYVGRSWGGCEIYFKKVIGFLHVFFRAQIKIIGVIALICLAGFYLSGVEGAFFLALLTSCMDLLPFIGTGIIIVPLLLWKVVNGGYYQAFLLLVTYISPVLTLLGIYVGIQLLGVAGIVLGPLYVLMLHVIYEELGVGKMPDPEKE